MPWQVRVLEDHPVVETCYTGRLSADELAAAVRETLAAARAHNEVLVLGDCTGLEGGHSIFDLFATVDLVIASGLAGRMREAVLLPSLPESLETVHFWETACRNRGLCVRIFADRQEALHWLLHP